MVFRSMLAQSEFLTDGQYLKILENKRSDFLFAGIELGKDVDMISGTNKIANTAGFIDFQRVSPETGVQCKGEGFYPCPKFVGKYLFAG